MTEDCATIVTGSSAFSLQPKDRRGKAGGKSGSRRLVYEAVHTASCDKCGVLEMSSLHCADDVVLMASSASDLQHSLARLTLRV